MKAVVLSTISLFLIHHIVYAQFTFQYDQTIPVSNNAQELNLAWTGGLNSPQFNKMDLDNDGTDDLVIFERTANRLLTFISKDEQFYYQPEYAHFFPEDIEGWLLLKDFNCDGKKDIFTNTLFGIKVYKNISAGTPAWELMADPIYTIGSSGEINLQVNVIDIPGISDIDNDGDLDILVYDFSVGGFIRYHKNLSMENYDNCDHLEYERITRQWGHFEECECDYFAFNGESCDDVVKTSGRMMHPGGKTMLFIDNDGDGDKDFIMSQEDCNKLYYLENVGTTEDALMTDFSMSFPNETNPAHLNLFPAAFYEDVDFDGTNDLLVAPNVSDNIFYNIDFARSSWFYKNSGTNDNPEFEFITKQFLQSEMMEAGERAYPVFADYDSDGDFDLFLAGNNKLINGMYFGAVTLYENTGDRNDPAFILKEKDYLNISDLKLLDIHFSFAEFNNDRKKDLVVFGNIPFSNDAETYLFLNSSVNNRFSFSEKIKLSTPIKRGDHPLFYDVNLDKKTDLMIGKPTGRLEYYKNFSSGTQPEFQLMTENLAQIDDNYQKRNLVPAVGDIDGNGTKDLITINDSGIITVYHDFFSNNLDVTNQGNVLISNEFTMDPVASRLGYKNVLAVTDLYNNQLPVIAIGTVQGGMYILKNTRKRDFDNEKLELILSPNPPSGNLVEIQTSKPSVVGIISLTGQIIVDNVETGPDGKLTVDVSGLASGIYLVKAESGSTSTTKRLLVFKESQLE